MEESVKKIALEVREDFQIPPYFSDDALERIVNESIAKLQNLNPNASIETDITFKELVKNRVFYAYHHKLDEFGKNYASDILTWQLETPVESEGNNENGIA